MLMFGTMVDIPRKLLSTESFHKHPRGFSQGINEEYDYIIRNVFGLIVRKSYRHLLK